MLLHTDINEINNEQWDALVEYSPTATFFQTRECYDFYASLSFLEPFIYAVSEEGKLVGLICGYITSDANKLKQFFSRRAIVPGGLLLDVSISDAALHLLLNKVKQEISRQSIYIEIRNLHDFSFVRSAIESSGFRYQSHLNIHVCTTDINSVWTGLSDSKKRQIKSSVHAGVQLIETKDRNDINELNTILKALYKNKIKKPLFPFEFFEKLQQLPSARFIVVKYNDKILGGIICVVLHEKAVYEWFVCGEDVKDQKVYTSVMATWAGIDYAAKNNFQYFDFMGAGQPDKEYGVREFKSKFGGQLVEHGRFLYICKPFLYSLGKSVLKLNTFFTRK